MHVRRRNTVFDRACTASSSLDILSVSKSPEDRVSSFATRARSKSSTFDDESVESRACTIERCCRAFSCSHDKALCLYSLFSGRKGDESGLLLQLLCMMHTTHRIVILNNLRIGVFTVVMTIDSINIVPCSVKHMRKICIPFVTVMRSNMSIL